MAYSLANFHVDPINGDDTPPTALVFDDATNPSGSVVRIETTGSHDLVVGALLDISLSGYPLHYANGRWKVANVPTATTFDLALADADLFLPLPATPDLDPVGGASWNAPFATLTHALLVAGPSDTIRHVASPETVVTNGLWTQGPTPTPLEVTDADGDVITIPDHTAIVGDIVRVGTPEDLSGELSGVWRVDDVTGDELTLVHPVTGDAPASLAPGGPPGAGVLCQVITSRTVQFGADLEVLPLPMAGMSVVGGHPDGITPRVGFEGTGYVLDDILTVGGLGLRVTAVGGGGEVTTLAFEDYDGTGGFTVGNMTPTGGSGTGLQITIASVFDGCSLNETSVPSRIGGGVLTVSTTGATYPSEINIARLAFGSPTQFFGFHHFQCWIRSSAVALNGKLAIETTDTAGTVVHERIDFPNLPAANEWCLVTVVRSGEWWPLPEDPGEFLFVMPPQADAVTLVFTPDGSGIQFEIDVPTFTRRDRPNLGSVVSRDGTDEPRHAIEAIDGPIAYLSAIPGRYVFGDFDQHGYTGASGTDDALFTHAFPGSGATLTPTAPVSIVGGWAPDDIVPSGETLFDGGCRVTPGFIVGDNGLTLERLGFFRFLTGLSHAATTLGTNVFARLNRCRFGYCNVGLKIERASGWLVDELLGADSCVTGIDLRNAHNCIIAIENAVSNCQTGVLIDPECANNAFTGGVVASCGIGVWLGGHDNRLTGLNADRCARGVFMRAGGINVLDDAIFTLCGVDIWTWSLVPGSQTRLRSLRHNLTGRDRQYEYGAMIEAEPSTRPGGSGNMWTLTLPRLDVPPIDLSRPETSHLELRLGLVGINGGGTVSIESAVRQVYPENTRASVVVKANPAVGLPEDLTIGFGSTSGWQTIAGSLNPTAAGVIEIVLRVWRTNATAFNGIVQVDTLRVSQA